MELSERSLGWLRYLHRKAHTPDDWSREGRPHPHWDDRSDPPMASWHGFDLVDSSYAMGLMAHRTPAWTEPYVAVLDQLIERHTAWWSASDWLTPLGHDPDRANSPDSYRLFIPPELFGDYDAPGWNANGSKPWGVQMDPVAADGMLFYKGFFLVLLGIRSMIAGDDDRWNRPFEMIRDGDNSFTWTHSEIAGHLCRQWLAAPIGCHSEDTMVWPHRLAAAGLGLRLHDNRHGTDFHRQAFAPWWQYAREHYLDLTGDAAPDTTTFYYDSMLDVHHRLPVAAALTTSFYAAPQEPDDARRLFEAGYLSIGLGGEPQLPLKPNRAIGSSLVLAHEWGLDDLADRLSRAIDESYEPTWDTERGEFTWGLGLDEPHPRGQFNAFLAAGEAAGPGMWTRLSEAPLEPCPQIVGVDFPTMAFTRAEWVDGNLRLRLAPLHEDPTRRTSFRVIGAEPRIWDVHGMDGVSLDVSSTGLEVRVPMIAGDLELIRGSY